MQPGRRAGCIHRVCMAAQLQSARCAGPRLAAWKIRPHAVQADLVPVVGLCGCRVVGWWARADKHKRTWHLVTARHGKKSVVDRGGGALHADDTSLRCPGSSCVA